MKDVRILNIMVENSNKKKLMPSKDIAKNLNLISRHLSSTLKIKVTVSDVNDYGGYHKFSLSSKKALEGKDIDEFTKLVSSILRQVELFSKNEVREITYNELVYVDKTLLKTLRTNTLELGVR